MFKNLLAVIMVLALPGCGTFVPVIDMSTVPKEKLQQSFRIKVYEISSASTYPEVIEYIGSISAFSCKHMLYDPPASRGDALAQLRLVALNAGADAIIDLTYDTRGTDAFGTNCWESVQASGVAVKLKK